MEKDRDAAFISALTAEHFVLQSAVSATVTEAGARASLYVLSLSSSLIAMGFMSQSVDLLFPFAATVLPALFLLGLFTIVRLIDTGIENQRLLIGIGRIRKHYRTLTPEAAIIFSAASGRWPESNAATSLRFGASIAFLTTAASMIAVINGIVAGAEVALLTSRFLWHAQPFACWLAGAACTALFILAFAIFQRRQYNTIVPEQARQSD